MLQKGLMFQKAGLYEMTAGHKIGRPGKGVPKQLELDTPADAQTTTQVVKHQADDLGNNQGTKRQKGETSSTKKGGKAQKYRFVSRTYFCEPELTVLIRTNPCVPKGKTSEQIT